MGVGRKNGDTNSGMQVSFKAQINIIDRLVSEQSFEGRTYYKMSVGDAKQTKTGKIFKLDGNADKTSQGMNIFALETSFRQVLKQTRTFSFLLQTYAHEMP